MHVTITCNLWVCCQARTVQTYTPAFREIKLADLGDAKHSGRNTTCFFPIYLCTRDELCVVYASQHTSYTPVTHLMYIPNLHLRVAVCRSPCIVGPQNKPTPTKKEQATVRVAALRSRDGIFCCYSSSPTTTNPVTKIKMGSIVRPTRILVLSDLACSCDNMSKPGKLSA